MDLLKPCIEIIEVTKQYENSLIAIDNVSMNINVGEIYGFVGRNGAGKTTLINIITGLLPPSKGSVKLLEMDVRKSFDIVKKYIGFVGSENIFYNYLTGREYILFIGKIKGESEKNIIHTMDYLVEILDFKDKLDEVIINYSTGTKRKLAMVSQLINYPKMLILDEPMNGLDPVINNKMKELIKNVVKNKKMTVFISAHQLDVIEHLCDRFGIIDNGKLLFNGTIEDISRISSNTNFEETVISIIKGDSNENKF